jgi:uncharacterized Zn finger protein
MEQIKESERQKIMSILSLLREDAEKYITEITLTKETFSQLKCEQCGAGEFEEGKISLETPEGSYRLLRCRYCGFQGIISKQGLSYKVTIPKLDKTRKVKEDKLE